MGNICSVSIPCDAMATRCWDDCIRGRAMYICKLEDNLAALERASRELQATKDDLINKVNLAEQQHLKRLEKVQLWLSNVADVKTQVDELIGSGPQEIDDLCIGGFCSKNCRSSYKFGKRVAQILEHVTALKRDGEFKEVAEKLPADPVDLMPCDSTVGLESSFDRAWSCLQNKKFGVVGIYGVGGVGKTTLLTQLNNKLHDMQIGFDKVIWILVSRDAEVEKIQDGIGKKIGLFDETWKTRSHVEKAIDILKVLSKRKFVLLLDDIWKPINLTEVGIPQPDDQSGSKVLFTTRSEKVCFEMNAQEKIPVECLAWEKAWELFRVKVGEETLQSDSEIPKLAETVAKKCGGLPLALTRIGITMSGKKTPRQWNHAIDVLTRNASEFSDMGDKVLPVLKYSYDSIRDGKIKSCFLYCALFPEDFSIPKEELIEYWIGEGFLDGYDRSGAENEGYEIIGFLLQASLLEDGDENNSVKMHDVVREMALWIANGCGKSVKDHYLVRAGARLVEAPDVAEWKESTRVSLMINQIKNLTQAPECPNLLTLFLCSNYLENIVDDFFQDNALLVEELHGLKYLNTLTIDIESDVAWKSFLSSERLQSCTEGLSLHCKEGPHQFQLSCLANMKRLKTLWISGLKGGWASEEGRERQAVMKHDLHHNSVFVTPSERCCRSLRDVTLVRCSGLQELTCLIIIAPNLQYLMITGCKEMKEIIRERKLVSEFPEVLESFNPFTKLESLRLFGLSQLESIYPSSLSFPCLREMWVKGCPNLKKLPLNSNTATGNDSQFKIVGLEDWWKKLYWEDESTRTAFLPCFDALDKYQRE
ncbi:NB-ARC domain-containing protein [Cephalotus follicularis]|uniref:NB-ARC domain-containing protein n=1 Tax=Cephalotus follicularis TaxID=3775 RepID=A0A1Q3C5T9_CEPFO|nr:NB-ARC domain-containing protein [Cephalotus follicularis]